jgi:hypothetical protein
MQRDDDRHRENLRRRLDMASEGIAAVFLTTHNWGKAAKFFQALGFTLEFETDHNSGQLRNGAGPYLFIAEVPANEKPEAQIVLKVADADAFQAAPIVDVVAGGMWKMSVPPAASSTSARSRKRANARQSAQ